MQKNEKNCIVVKRSVGREVRWAQMGLVGLGWEKGKEEEEEEEKEEVKEEEEEKEEGE